MGKNKKKILLFIVEGVTDEISLGLILSKLFNDKHIRFQLVRGDITSDIYSTPQNIIRRINEQITKFLDNNHFTRKDIDRIVHLVDIDGVYINDNNIVENTSLENIIYHLDSIEVPNKKYVVDRNKRKRLLLNKLSTINKISNLDYKIYFFSCNLEHVLHNNQNVEDNQKYDLAKEIRDRYAMAPNDFITFINSEEFKINGEYIETWEYIKNDLNSLNRNSNFHLFFNK